MNWHHYGIALLLASLSTTTYAQTLQCKIVKVVDGDTVHCLENRTQHKVRLDGIDAPERGQAFGRKAQQVLSQRIIHQSVNLQLHGSDRYKRKIATVLLNGEDINAWLIREGYAWAYRKHLRGKKKITYVALENRARRYKLGLWIDGERAIYPEIYRKQRRNR
ncbi:MAG: thermonuclease family protein [Pelistega sp.]|nr:thermonuclease family protein [Pelistega sp.]